MASYFDDVGEFNRKFGLPSTADGDPPRMLEDDVLTYRTKFMVEELQEFRDACASNNLPEAADALVDLVYVALGTAHMMGVPFDECWAEVQRANMEKVRARSADESKRGHSLDVVKPEGWQPPDIARILSSHKTFKVTSVTHGYNHDVVVGSCTGPVTVEDVQKRFYHEYFGGRDAWVKDGRFGCTVHGCD